jgi:hypothetical protein
MVWFFGVSVPRSGGGGGVGVAVGVDMSSTRTFPEGSSGTDG